jgi:hypothetical protein
MGLGPKVLTAQGEIESKRADWEAASGKSSEDIAQAGRRLG